MITNSELFRKMMHASKELRMRSFQAHAGAGGGRRPEPPVMPGMCRRQPECGESGEMPRMPCHGKGLEGRGPHCRGGKHRRGMFRERLLIFIADHPDGVWQKDIAGEEAINASSASEMIGKLEEDGYLVREADASDKRAAVLKLTEKGKARADEIRAEREAALTELFSRLTDEEKQTLADLLDKLLG